MTSYTYDLESPQTLLSSVRQQLVALRAQ